MLLYAIVHSSPFSAIVFPRVIKNNIGVLNEVKCTICRKVRTQHQTSIIAFLYVLLFDVKFCCFSHFCHFWRQKYYSTEKRLLVFFWYFLSKLPSMYQILNIFKWQSVMAIGMRFQTIDGHLTEYWYSKS